MKTRAELNEAWALMQVNLSYRDARLLGGLIAAERAYVDRAGQAAAIRWANNHERGEWEMDSLRLQVLADRVEAGEVEIPK